MEIKLTHIFLDIGNVLIYVNKELAVRELSGRFGISAEEIVSELLHKLEPLYERGEISTLEYFQAVEALFKTDGIDVEDYLKRLLFKVFTPNSYLIAQLPYLKQRFRIYLLSNTNPFHIGIINRSYDLERKVNGALYSFSLGCLKPDALIYRRALELTGAVPDTTLFIDDLEDNITAARNMGFHTIRFENNLRLKSALKSFGIKLQHPLKIPVSA